MNFPEAKVRVIYEGVDPHFLNPVADKEAVIIRERYGLSRPYLVFLVGTPEPRKNLLKTVTAAVKAAPHLTLAIIGPQKPLLTLLGSSHRNIRFTGVVPDRHLPALLSGAEISLYPSLYEGFGLPVLESMACGVPVFAAPSFWEGFGMHVVEAMACGVPVIASNQGALPEIAGDAAILVQPQSVTCIADAIFELLRNDALHDRLKAAGKKRAAEFTWQKAAEATLSLYREMV